MPRIRALRREMLELWQRVDPSTRARPVLAEGVTVAFVCVYRRKNAAMVRTMLDGVPHGTVVRLWALDEPTLGLADLSLGRGAGSRTTLLNRLVGSLESPPDLLVIGDDDVVLSPGGLEQLLAIGSALELDVFQPAHSARSITAHRFVRKRSLVVARRTTFVEQGPLVALNARAQGLLLPLPEELGMGWGVEARWHELFRSDRLRAGVVDATTIRHVNPISHSYDPEPELRRMRQELAKVGADDMRDLQQELERIGLRRGLALGARPSD